MIIILITIKSKMKKLLVIGIIIVSMSIGSVITEQYRYRVEQVKKLQEIEYRMVLASSKLWVLKTRIEFPEFPPKIGIKSSNKTSMKRRTKI